MSIYKPVMSVAELQAFLIEAFPGHSEGEGVSGTLIEDVSPGAVRARLVYGDHHLRPGGTISGPTMMGLADHVMYALVLAHIGPVALAVTTNLNINFLRKPAPADLIAEARFVKLGRRLAVGEVHIYGGDKKMVAQVSCTYSIPPQEGGKTE